MDAQRTLRRQISCVGIGLHSGNKVNLTLTPAPADSGIRFRRTDLGNFEVPATVHNLAGIQLATGLACNEVSVETVEHLLAALVSVGVDNVSIDLNSPEVPIMDGSAAPFIYLIHEDVEMLRQNGLALGGSLENAIVLGEAGVLNNALRFEDEFVRHKILDAIGDLALVGYPVIGHLVAHRAGHALHTAFAAKILEESHAWRLVESPVDAPVPVPLPINGAAARLAN